MKLVVGLGNPGKEYEQTRHNIGFIIIDEYLDNKNRKADNKKFNSLYTDLVIDGEKVLFIKPQTYMNLSGEAIKKFVKYYNIEIENILIICDDVNFDTGKVRLRKKGSSGGHNGINSIIQELKTDEFKRLKVGISKNELIETKDYVLGKFTKEEIKILDDKMSLYNNIIDDFINLDFDNLVSKYN